MITAIFNTRESFGQAFQPRLDLGAMTASVAAHAIVVALLVITWREETMVEGGTRSALISIDLSAQEGGRGPKAQFSARADEAAAAPPPVPQSHKRPDVPDPHPLPSPSPSSPAHASYAEPGGGGEGHRGQGSAAITTRAAPMATMALAQASLAFTSPALAGPAAMVQRGQGQDRAAGAHAAGGTGGGLGGAAGNSAVSNYKGRVYQHLLRYRQTNTIGAGTVLISFVVEPGGGTRGISIARSSGSSRFDREAMQLVRRAAPLPSPPDGASHSFTFEIAGQ